MKRCLALFLGIAILCVSCLAYADTLDLSVLKDNKLINVDINNDGNAFVESVIGHTSFTHENAIEDYLSYVYSDIIIGDYYSSSPVALWRFWVSYSEKNILELLRSQSYWMETSTRLKMLETKII